jgi:hypothetical protein
VLPCTSRWQCVATSARSVPIATKCGAKNIAGWIVVLGQLQDNVLSYPHDTSPLAAITNWRMIENVANGNQIHLAA